ncbi:Alpha/Beta hydrolase protein, partial [Ochromonadaceae sp. CCMP2298]
VLLALALATAQSFTYDAAEANRTVWLSAAAYCPRASFASREFLGPTSGFVVTRTLYDAASDMQGFVGYLPSANSIYVVFRGSASMRNWIVDVETWQTPYTSSPECGCQVHAGFYSTEQAVISDVLSAVSQLVAKYPSYSVRVTGHSLGGAVALLAGLDLLAARIPNTMYSIGQPRVGDRAFALFAEHLPSFRITHDRDSVPHIPDFDGFAHACGEQFESAAGDVGPCTCEEGGDPLCAAQYSLSETSAADHMLYLGL